MATKNPTAQKRSAKLSNREADAIFNQVMSYRPAVSRNQWADDLEKLFAPSSSFSVARRLGALIGASDGEWFQEVAKDREMAVLMAGQLEAVEAAVSTLREIADSFEGGATRLRIALCNHEDIEALYKEAAEHPVVTLAS